jgi:hypothetical protein
LGWNSAKIGTIVPLSMEWMAGMPELHRVVGFAVVGGFFLLAVWGLISFLRKRPAGEWFWRLLAILQVALVAQLVVGIVLLVLGGRQPLLHYLYGALFPVIVLAVAHILGRGMDDERDTLRVFAVAAFIVFGLTLRALATGLGLG